MASTDSSCNSSSKKPSIAFKEELEEIFTIPPVDKSRNKELYYQESEIWIMKCDYKMSQAGLDPDNLDWRSFR